MKTENFGALILGFAVILLLIGAGYLYSSQSPPDQNRPPSQVIEPVGDSEYNFGQISMAAGKVSHLFSLRNRSPEPVVIEKIYTSCMCTEAQLSIAGQTTGPYGMAGHGLLRPVNRTVQPGENFTVKVIFDPAAHGPAGLGPFERTVYVQEPSGIISLVIRGSVSP